MTPFVLPSGADFAQSGTMFSPAADTVLQTIAAWSAGHTQPIRFSMLESMTGMGHVGLKSIVNTLIDAGALHLQHKGMDAFVQLGSDPAIRLGAR